MKQPHKLGIILTVSVALLTTVIASTKLAHSTQDTTVVQPAKQGNTDHTPKPIDQPILANTINKTNSPIREQTTATATSSPQPTSTSPLAAASTDNNQSISDPTPDVGILTGYIYYDANGNACGIGPSGICLIPVVKSFEIRDSTNNLVQVVTSNTEGAFKTALNPGTYKIIPEAGDGVNPNATQQTVTISKTQYATITITYWAIAVTNSPILN